MFGGVVLSPSTGLMTTEAGGTDTFSIALTSQPTAPVTINVSSSDVSEGIPSPVSFSFDAGNWNVAQSVTVTGVNDTLEDGHVPYFIVTEPAIGGDYDGLNAIDVSVTNIDNEGESLDFDDNGVADAATDGLLTLRYLFGFRGAPLIDGVIGAGADNDTPAEVESAFITAFSALDADGNGNPDAATDGILILRYLFGFRDEALVTGAVGPGATRTDGAAVAAFLDGFVPAPAPPAAPPPSAAPLSAGSSRSRSQRDTVCRTAFRFAECKRGHGNRSTEFGGGTVCRRYGDDGG